MRVSGRRLGELVRRFKSVRALVAGDLMLDTFVRGKVQRISPEAPVPVVQWTGEDQHLGGAGNVVCNVAALGGRAEVCGVVGDDPAGRQLVELLARLRAGTAGVVRVRDRETTQKTRIVAHKQQVVRLDRDPTAPLDDRAVRRLRDEILARRRRVHVLVVSDYGKGAIGPELLAALADAHRRASFTWLVDPKQANFAHYRRATLVKPNREEAAAAAGLAITDEASLRAVGAKLLRQWQTEAVLVSRGEEGMALFKKSGEVETFPTVARDVFDVTGAGDTVLATCALALGAGGTLEEATVLANHAAGIVVGKFGTATASAVELLAAVRGR